MALRQGAEALRESIDRAKSSGNGAQTNWFQWKDGETKTLRFLTDVSKIYVLNMHDYVLCADGKRRTFVCRKELDESCPLCSVEDVRKREMGWGLAVLRKEIRQDVEGKSKLVGYEDFTEEKDDKVQPHVGIVRQAPTNFWIQIDGIQEKYGSIRDRDLDIIRKGGDKSTVYMAYPCDPVEIPNLDERYAKYTPDLKALLEGMGTLEYYGYFDGSRKAGDRREGGGGSGGAPAASRPEESPVDEQTEFDRLRAEVEAAQTNAGAGSTYS